MLLYEHPLSSYDQKVKIALREKGLKFDAEVPQALGSGNSTGPFAAASPRLEVPTLFTSRIVSSAGPKGRRWLMFNAVDWPGI